MEIDIKKFVSQEQQADVCVLFSYWRFLQYFNPRLTFHSFCKYYIQYINAECDILNNLYLQQYISKEISAQKHNPKHQNKNIDEECKVLFENNLVNNIENINPLPLEILTYAVLHCYCQKIQNDIRGLSHICTLHGILKQNKDIPFPIPESVVHFTEDQAEIKQYIEDLSKGIIDFLILVFKTSNGGHAIILTTYNNEIYIGDPNINKLKRLSVYKTLQITPKFENNNTQSFSECLIFKLN